MARCNLLFILGTRPEAIKALPVIRALRRNHPQVRVVVGATGQHAMLFDQIADMEGLKPAWNLEVMAPRQQIPGLIASALSGLEGPVRREKADWVVVTGDSASTLAGTLAAHAALAPVAHIEAGLRGEREGLPFPEESFRRMISAAAAFHFAPTDPARENLSREGVSPTRIEVPGDPGLDLLVERLQTPPRIEDPTLADLDPDRPIALVAITRRENHAEEAFEICHALKRLARARPDLQIVVVPHINPHIMEPMRSQLRDSEGIRMILPLPHGPFIDLMRKSRIVLSDSGGVHEEASFLGVPLLSLRVCPDRGRLLGPGRILRAESGEQAILAGALELLKLTESDARSSTGGRDYAPAGPKIAARLAALVDGDIRHPAHFLKPATGNDA